MKYAVFSDIHANLESFEAVLRDIKKQKVDGYVFVGDIIGYGADPNACMDMLRSLIDKQGCLFVAGNHDYAVCDLTRSDHYNIYARLAIDWTKEHLNKEHVRFLQKMPLIQKTDDFTAVHASLDDPQEWKYVLDIDDADQTFKRMETKVCFIGHSHRPVIFTSNDIVDWFIDEEVVTNNHTRYVVNIGSVGQPRDGDPRSAYAVYDTESGVIHIRRVPYDIEKAQEKIIAAGLPHILAERLSLGK